MAPPRRDRSGRFARNPKVGGNDKAWRKILGDVQKLAKLRVHVGVLASKGGDAQHDDESGLSLIELTAIHEFGSPAAHIPERAPIRTTFAEKQEEIGTVCTKAARAMLGGMTPERALTIVGLFTSTEVKKRITHGPHLPPPLKPATIARKGSDRPLVDTGRLVNAITYEVTNESGELVA